LEILDRAPEAAESAPRHASLVEAAWQRGLFVPCVFACACGLVLALGFDHVSDDDYARVTIAQAFAHQPAWDPSGTSWLPFPFWVLGSLMAVFGRTLGVARAASIVLASLAAWLPYGALRSAGVRRRNAYVGTAFALLSPWSLWLGASTVPESFTASATAAAAVALSNGKASAKALLGFSSALLAACLSRYEPWPIAALLGVVLALRGLRTRSPASLLGAALCALGPLGWIAWNLHAHGEALHFFARVSHYKRALGEGSSDTMTALLLYPHLFVQMRPEVLLATACALGAAAHAKVLRATASRWGVALGCVAAQVAFLAYGNAQDGAPTHHAERALLASTFVLGVFAVDVLADLRAGRKLGAAFDRAAFVLVLGAWLVTTFRGLRRPPGHGAGEDRTDAIALGLALRNDGVRHVAVTPCAYEHFALIAAFGAPERVTIRPNDRNAPSCPTVEWE
jgi:hypothetical protein